MSLTLEIVKTDYSLGSVDSRVQLQDDGFMLEDAAHPGELLRTYYAKKHLTVGPEELGLYKFADWLPVNHFLAGSSAPVTYKSAGLAGLLGLNKLYITFSGYWPEKEVFMYTGTFKECEAYSVCGRLPEDFKDTLVVASAGNTARAFARVCSENNIKLLLVVPDARKHKLWFKDEINSCVKLITVGGNSDYYDAIKLADKICEIDGFVAEGGARNVARRDGMGTTVLSAVSTIGSIPDYYFQAVGSGTGAIAAWEANLRFITSGEYGTNKMSLQVSQNKPFVPMYKAWKKRSRELLPLSEEMAKEQLSQIYADVLANRYPAYSMKGGLFDALSDTYGHVHAMSNTEAERAAQLFQDKEGIDIEPAAAVAVASLIKSVENGLIDKKALIMLNITGGGIDRFKKEHEICHLKPARVYCLTAVDNVGKVKEEVVKLFS